MITEKTISEPGLNITFMNYKNAFIVDFEGASHRRTYRKVHGRRKSSEEFNNFVKEIISYDFINDRFRVLEHKGFKKVIV